MLGHGIKELVAITDGYRESTSARCSRPPKNNAAGFTSRPMCLLGRRNQRIQPRFAATREIYNAADIGKA